MIAVHKDTTCTQQLQCVNGNTTRSNIDARHMMDDMQHALFMQPVAREEAPAPWLSSRPRAHMNTHRYDVLLSAILKSLEFRIN